MKKECSTCRFAKHLPKPKTPMPNEPKGWLKKLLDFGRYNQISWEWSHYINSIQCMSTPFTVHVNKNHSCWQWEEKEN